MLEVLAVAPLEFFPPPLHSPPSSCSPPIVQKTVYNCFMLHNVQYSRSSIVSYQRSSLTNTVFVDIYCLSLPTQSPDQGT